MLYTGLAEGTHIFALKSFDNAQNVSAVVTFNWQIDLTAPTVMITSGPSGFINTSTATFQFSGSNDIVGFQCKLDRGNFSACTSPMTYTGLTEGVHAFSLTGIDGAQNQSGIATSNFAVD